MTIEEIILSKHTDDKEQISAIFSEEKRIILNAPAGYGKTQTLDSKIAYLIAADKLPRPKMILALTFSVNAAYKIKIAVANELPKSFANELRSPVAVKRRVIATNYHGFCRGVLRKYGYLLTSEIKRINDLTPIDDKTFSKMLRDAHQNMEAEKVDALDTAINNANKDYVMSNYIDYLGLVEKYLLVNGVITFNAIILFCITLFEKYDSLLKFYRCLFPYIIVDEFQDTNILGSVLLDMLIDFNTRLFFTGDHLQRIYGFIGAIPNIMEKATGLYGMKYMELKTNYRFKDKPQLLLLDKNLRACAENISNPDIKEPATIDLVETANQIEEAKAVSKLINKTLVLNSQNKIAVLVQQRSQNIENIMEFLGEEQINYFYALYTEDDIEYKKFHKISLEYFLRISGTTLNKRRCAEFISSLSNIEGEFSDIRLYKSLIQLLSKFIEKIFVDYKSISNEDKVELIRDVLENNALKQYLIAIDSAIVVSTVHAAKGLEWDYVILPDMEQYSFPNWYGLCNTCAKPLHCELNWGFIDRNNEFGKKFYDELSVFYVAATRARSGIYFTYSKINYKSAKMNCSCLLTLPGIIINNLSSGEL